MPKVYNIEDRGHIRMVFPEKSVDTCKCEENELPPWTAELHGLSQALLSRTFTMKFFWWLVMIVCITGGTTTTVMVIIEYLQGPTATSTTIRLIGSLELPAITVCPKIPDAFNAIALLADIQHAMPNLTNDECLDVVRFWIGGYGLENMDELTGFNKTYMNKLNDYFTIWSQGYTVEDFFELMQEKYGYQCEDLFFDCQLGGNTYDCCNDLFVKRVIMRRGTCYTTRRGVNQTEADDMGRLILQLKAPSSITSPRSNYIQNQIIVYITDNYEHILDFPRFYLYPQEWNRMRFTARFLELLEQQNVCTNRIFGKDAECTIRRWLLSNIVYPYNCTLPYLNISKIPVTETCQPLVLASDYYNAVQLVWTSETVKEKCVPGCKRWDNQISLQQTKTLDPFEGYVFNLEASYNDLQFEYVKEVYTISVPGFMSQIGGQFGFFLGLSIITFIQMTLYAVHYCLTIFYKKTHRYMRSISEIRSRRASTHPRNSFAVNSIPPYKKEAGRRSSSYDSRRPSVVQISGRLIDDSDTAMYEEAKRRVLERQANVMHKNSIYHIDAGVISDLAASQNRSSDEDNCEKCNYPKKKKRKGKMRRVVTFAYRARPRRYCDIHRACSDGDEPASGVPENQETSLATFQRVQSAQKVSEIEDDNAVSESKENVMEIINSAPLNFINNDETLQK